MPFDRFMPTKFGESLLAKTHTGAGLILTGVVIGDGIPVEPIQDMMKIKSEKMRLPIISIEPAGDMSVITFRLRNNELNEGFYYREIGILGRDPDSSTQGLYLYSRCHGEAEFIADKTDTVNRIDAMVRVRIKFSETDQIYFETGDNPLYVLYTEYKQKTDALQASIDGHDTILADHEIRIKRLEDALFNNISTNPFMVRFNNLDGVIVTGVWNQALQRMEC